MSTWRGNALAPGYKIIVTKLQNVTLINARVGIHYKYCFYRPQKLGISWHHLLSQELEAKRKFVKGTYYLTHECRFRAPQLLLMLRSFNPRARYALPKL